MKGSQQGKGGKDIREEKRRSRGEKALARKRGEEYHLGKGAKDLRKEKGEDLRLGKGLRGDRGDRISTEKGGKRS